MFRSQRVRASRKGRSTTLFGALVAGVFVVAVAAAVARLPNRSSDEAGTVVRYERALTPLVKHGGDVVEVGVKAGLRDLGGEHRSSPELIARQADQCEQDLISVHRDLLNVAPPREVAAAHQGFLDALVLYTDSAELIARAARTPEPER